MGEQQRVFVAVLACLGILLGWQFLASRLQPPQSQRPVATRPVAATEGQADQTLAAEARARAGGDGVVPPVTPGATAAGPEQAGTTSASAARIYPEASVELVSQQLQGEISSVRAAFTRVDLLGYGESREGGPVRRAVSLASERGRDTAGQAEIRLRVGGRDLATFQVARAADGSALLSHEESASGVGVTLRIAPRPDQYAVDYELDIANRGADSVRTSTEVRLSLGWRDGKQSMFAPPADELFGVCQSASGMQRRLGKALSDKGPLEVTSGAAWGAIDRQYFVVAVAPEQGLTGRCLARAHDRILTLEFHLGDADVPAAGMSRRRFTVFMGPKKVDELRRVTESLAGVIDYNIWGIPLGFLARPMVFLMNVFHGWTASWGTAIMLLTLVVKLLLFPVTYKSVVSMRKMQLLKPELERIKQQFASDRERQQMEQLKLFRDKGVNPVGGCLPMLLQMPVWFALYRTLWTSVDLYQQPFLWLPDLTAKEPFPFLALALGALTFVQQRITPMAADNQQAKIMLYVMPVMLTVFMIALPSGLVLYILVNSVLTIVQQLAINRRQIAL